MRKQRVPAIVTAMGVAVLGLTLAVSGCKRSGEAEPTTTEQADPAKVEAPKEGEEEAGEVVAERAPVGQPVYDPQDRLGTVGSPWKGAADAPVTIVEYSSYQCPFCGRVQPTLKEIAEKFPNDVRLVFKQHPLPNQANSGPAAEAALEAHAQGKFWEFHDLLLANQRAIARPDLERYAEQVGLDMNAFRQALDTGKHKERVQKDLADAGKAGIRGTPNFLINGRNVVGAQPFDAFATVIREEITATRELMAAGKSLAEAYAERLEKNLAAKPAPPAQPPQPDPAAKMSVPVGNSPTKGGAQPLVTLVEFSSYQCPFCARVRDTVTELMEQYGDDLQVVFKHRPLAFQANSEPAAKAAIAAQNQGRFWEFHNKLFDNQRELTPDNFLRWAQELGLDMDRFRADLESPATAARLAEDTTLADRLVAQGTPHFFVNGYRLRGAQPTDAFRAIIDREIKVAQALVAGGTPRGEVYARQQADAVTGAPPMIGGDRPGQPAAPAAPVKLEAGNSVAMGPSDAKVTVVEFSDFKCGFCGRLAEALAEVKPDYVDRVQFVSKQFPLGRWPESQKAAEGALAAHAQGKYAEFAKEVYANQRTFNDAMIFEIAGRIGLDMDRFRSELDSNHWADQVRKDTAEGRAAGVSGTPSLFLNGERIGGALSAEQLRAAIDRALAQ